ncbi:hypothetical protein [Neobacillus cucumis]|nr:hypothetical protein [Neobacillus cucumis]
MIRKRGDGSRASHKEYLVEDWPIALSVAYKRVAFDGIFRPME